MSTLLNEEQKAWQRAIIADHVRAGVFIITDGVMPSGKQRGYVLRRLIRRALLASLKLGIDITNVQYFEELVDSVIAMFDGVYDELKESRDTAVSAFHSEALKFTKAITTGQKEWSKILGTQVQVTF